MTEMMQRQGRGQPGNIGDVNKMVEDMMRQMQGRMQVPNFPFQGLPGQWGRGGGGRGRIGLGRPNALVGDGRMGIRIETPSAVLIDQLDLPKEKGMVVSDVRADSVADKAGIKINDIVMEVDGKAVSSEPAEFVRMISEIKADTPVNVTVLRKGRKETIKGMKLPEVAQRPQLPPDQPFPDLRLRGGFVFPPVSDRQAAVEAVSEVSINRNNDEFTINFRANDLKGKVTGVVVEGKAVVSDIDLNDNGTNIKAKSIDKLDKKHQRMIQQMLQGIR